MNKTVELEEDTKAVSAINVSDPDATIFFSVEPSINVQLVLTLAYSSPPNSSHFSNTTVLGQEGTRVQVSRDLRLISMHTYKYTSYKYTHLCRLTGCLGVQWKVFLTSTWSLSSLKVLQFLKMFPTTENFCRPCLGFSVCLCPLGGYRWMITPEMLQQTAGLWYIEARPINSTMVPGLKLQISLFMTKCLYWDERNETWSTAGCQAGVRPDLEVLAFVVCSCVAVAWCCQCDLLWPQVGEKSTPEQAQCLCNHLTLFGSSFFVMPNHVDISRTAELFATVSDNFVVLALLCAFFGLYLATLLWACYADRRSSSKVRLCTSVVGCNAGWRSEDIRITFKKHTVIYCQVGLEQKSVFVSQKTDWLIDW